MAEADNNIFVTVVQGTPVNVSTTAINGTQGIQGIQGDQGIQGIQGVAGADGADGATGATGSAGATAYPTTSEHSLATGQDTVTHTTTLVRTVVWFNGLRLAGVDWTNPAGNDIQLVTPVQTTADADIIVETYN